LIWNPDFVIIHDNEGVKINNYATFIYYYHVVKSCLASVVIVIHVAQTAHVMDVAEIKQKPHYLEICLDKSG